jgi:hypothetical protein
MKFRILFHFVVYTCNFFPFIMSDEGDNVGTVNRVYLAQCSSPHPGFRRTAECYGKIARPIQVTVIRLIQIITWVCLRLTRMAARYASQFDPNGGGGMLILSI